MDIVYRFDPHAPMQRHVPRSNQEALRYLEQGNERFHKTVEHLQAIAVGDRDHPPMVIPVDPIRLGIPIVSGLEPAHAPFALVLGCSDARAPIEHVLDCSANDLFVVRVAGNVLGLECLGSVDYAATVLRESLQSVIVMGHTGCGAVSAAVDVYCSPSNFADVAFSHPVRSLVDRIMLSVRSAARGLEQSMGSRVHKHPSYREWLMTTSCFLNAAVTAFDLQREVNAVANGLSVSYTIYDMAWTRIGALPIRSSDEGATTDRFAPAPTSTADFESLVQNIIRRLDPND
jgi:carbonic anhydrase